MNYCFQSGHLIKLSGKLKTWRKRWFTLKDGTLTYWKSQHDVNRKPQGQIHLDDKCRVTREEGASTFEINTGKKMYYLTADSNASMDDWVKTLQVKPVIIFLFGNDDEKISFFICNTERSTKKCNKTTSKP